MRTKAFQTIVAQAVAALLFTLAEPAQAEVDVRRDAVVEAIARTRPSVVNISTEELVEVRDQFEDPFFEFFSPFHRRPFRTHIEPRYSLGSGVIIDDEGFILTNAHVVQRANRIAVVIGTNLYDAKLEAISGTSDIALLKIEPKAGEKFPAVKFAKDDDLLLGETVIALGNPFGLGLSVSRGILSSTARRPQPDERGPLNHQDWLQTDAAVNSGNSGGPLINLRGELIGINNAILAKGQGISFAIPIKRVGESLSEIFTPENKGFWFGAHIKSEESRLVIDSVQRGSPAEKSGLKAGDTVVRIADVTPKNFIEFMVELIKRSEKKGVSMVIAQGTKQRTVNVEVVREETVFNTELIRQKLGITVQALTPEIAEALAVQAGDGLVISGVDKNTPAAQADLRPGFIITGVDDEEMNDVKAVAKKLYGKRKGDEVTLSLFFVQRQGGFLFPKAGRITLKVR